MHRKISIFLGIIFMSMALMAILLIHLNNRSLTKSFIDQSKQNAKIVTALLANQPDDLIVNAIEIAQKSTRTAEHPIQIKLKQRITEQIKNSPITGVDIIDGNGRGVYSLNHSMQHQSDRDDLFKSVMVKTQPVTLYKRATQTRARPENKPTQDLFITYFPLFHNDAANPVGVLITSVDYASQNELLERKKIIGAMAITLVIAIIYIASIGMLGWVRRQHLMEITTHRTFEKKLESSAFLDELTGLPNRQKLIQRLEYLIEECERSNEKMFAFMLTDLDSFKTLNESMGHYVGNSLLKQVSQRIRNCIRPDDLVTRIGGDEFGIILEGIAEISEAVGIAKRIHRTFNKKFTLYGNEFSETTSIGLTLISGKGFTSEDIIRNANIAMYRAKQKGRGHYELFNKHMHVAAINRVEVESEIRRGLKNSEFFTRFQPIVDLRTGLTTSLEALVRWAHPQKRELAPDKFIDIAEEISLVQDIDKLVLETAIGGLAIWQQHLPEIDHLSVNVNHSARNFSNRYTLENIIKKLSDYGIHGNSLKIELTESSILKNELVASSIFEELQNHGIHLCMDDFGTGFSSLSYLRKLHFNMLKIDQSFVRDMLKSEEAMQIVRTIINMGKHLNISVTAEGVETQEQLSILTSMGCQYAQGYYFAKPLKEQEVITFIRGQIERGYFITHQPKTKRPT